MNFSLCVSLMYGLSFSQHPWVWSLNQRGSLWSVGTIHSTIWEARLSGMFWWYVDKYREHSIFLWGTYSLSNSGQKAERETMQCVMEMSPGYCPGQRRHLSYWFSFHPSTNPRAVGNTGWVVGAILCLGMNAELKHRILSSGPFLSHW